MNTMLLKFVTPERVLLEEEVLQAVVTTTSGQVTILPKHISLITNLKPGEVIIKKKDGEEQPIAVSGGVMEVHDNNVIILADTAEHAHELDAKRAEEAVKLAEKLMAEKKYDISEYEAMQANLAKNKARLNVATKWRK